MKGIRFETKIYLIFESKFYREKLEITLRP